MLFTLEDHIQSMCTLIDRFGDGRSESEAKVNGRAAAEYATAVANDYAKKGGDVVKLFAALAGMVSAYDKAILEQCLSVVEIAISEEYHRPGTGPGMLS